MKGTCPSLTNLEAHVLGTAPDEIVGDHISSCVRCRRWAERVELGAEEYDAYRPLLDSKDDVRLSMEAWSPTKVSVFGMPTDPVTQLRPGSDVGAYSVIELLGQGGMGVVYRAQQDRPRRVVAIKILKHGRSSASVLRRFEHEADILARLSHPSIAQIYDTGLADLGLADGVALPYITMELVEGRPLCEHAQAFRLSIRERLELFLQVCDAIQHAHHRGVIHRDIKPSNILVEGAGAEGRVKVLDFGVARVTDGDVHTVTGFADINRLMGTVPYMSPEQCRGNAREVDTRSDVYALGVVLYELLSGRLPYELEDLDVLNALRVIRETPPILLSSHVRNLGGDLETIAHKALEKDRENRYDSASALASDVRRHLKGEPITARSPSMWCLVRQFARRRRALVVGAAAVALAVMIGTISTVWQARSALRANALAQARLHELEQSTEFLEDMIRSANPQQLGLHIVRELPRRVGLTGQSALPKGAEVGDGMARLLAEVNYTDLGREILSDDLLRHASDSIAVRFQDQPLLAARLWETLGICYQRIGDFAAAGPALQTACDIHVKELGPTALETVAGFLSLANLRREEGRLTDAASILRRILSSEREPESINAQVMNQARVALAGVYRDQGLFPEAEDLLLNVIHEKAPADEVAEQDLRVAQRELATLYQTMGKMDDAELFYERALDSLRQSQGDANIEGLTVELDLARLSASRGKYPQAEERFVQVIDRMNSVLGSMHPLSLVAASEFGALRVLQQRYDEAETLLAAALDRQRRILGIEHPSTVRTLGDLGGVRHHNGDYSSAAALYDEAARVQLRTLGPRHLNTLATRANQAALLADERRLDEAETMYHELIPILKDTLGTEHAQTINALQNLSSVYERQNRLAEAVELAEETLAIQLRTVGENHPSTVFSLAKVATLYVAQQRDDEALPYFVSAYKVHLSLHGSEHPRTLLSMRNLGFAYASIDRAEEAETTLLSCLDAHRRLLGEHYGETLITLLGLGNLYNEVGRFREAEPLLALAWAQADAQLAEDHWQRGGYLSCYGVCLLGLGRFEEAEKMLFAAHDILQSRLGPEHHRTRKVIGQIESLYETWGRPAEGALWKESQLACE